MTSYFANLPEASWVLVKRVLSSHDFSEIHRDDSQYIYFQKGEINVQVPKENKIFSLSLGDIISQSGIPIEIFLATMATAKMMDKE